MTDSMRDVEGRERAAASAVSERARLGGALAYLDSWIAYRAERLRIPGVQCAVWADGGIALSRAYGVSDVSTGVRLTTEHRFRIASHSKTFTATAVLRLAERGVLRLDDRVGDHVPQLRAASDAVAGIRVRELLSHGSGLIRDGVDSDFWQFSRPFPDAHELLAMLGEHAIVQPPNVSFKYTNVGYALLGLVIEGATGRPCNTVIAEETCLPLSLEGIEPEWDAGDSAHFASGHGRLRGERNREVLPQVGTRAFSPATGFASTAEALATFFSAHLPGDERLLSEASKREQQHEVWRSDPSRPESPEYGLGLISQRIGGRRWLGHSGGFPGFLTGTVFDPDAALVLSVLTNAIDAPVGTLVDGAAALLGAALDGSDERGGAPDPRTHGLTGRYENLWGTVDIVMLGNRLLLIDPDAAAPLARHDVLEVVDECTLRVVSGSGFGAVGETIVFERSGDRVTRMRGPGGMTHDPVRPDPLADPR